MDLGSLLVILALTIVVVVIIARPLVEKRSIRMKEFNRHGSELQAKKEQILMNLQELDMDHGMGKIPVDDYQARRAYLVARGVEILKELDQLNEVVPEIPLDKAGTNDQGTVNLEAQIEAEVRRRRGLKKGEDAGYCPQCGTKLHAGDRFCTRCGARVHMAEAEA
jgi:hypothetical protein